MKSYEDFYVRDDELDEQWKALLGARTANEIWAWGYGIGGNADYQEAKRVADAIGDDLLVIEASMEFGALSLSDEAIVEYNGDVASMLIAQFEDPDFGQQSFYTGINEAGDLAVTIYDPAESDCVIIIRKWNDGVNETEKQSVIDRHNYNVDLQALERYTTSVGNVALEALGREPKEKSIADFGVSTYQHDGNLAISVYDHSWHGYDIVSTNLGNPLPLFEFYFDSNNHFEYGSAFSKLCDTGVFERTLRVGRSGFCEYPGYRIDPIEFAKNFPAQLDEYLLLNVSAYQDLEYGEGIGLGADNAGEAIDTGYIAIEADGSFAKITYAVPAVGTEPDGTVSEGCELASFDIYLDNPYQGNYAAWSQADESIFHRTHGSDAKALLQDVYGCDMHLHSFSAENIRDAADIVRGMSEKEFDMISDYAKKLVEKPADEVILEVVAEAINPDTELVKKAKSIVR
jgi:hypothetical protein